MIGYSKDTMKPKIIIAHVTEAKTGLPDPMLNYRPGD